MTTKLGLGTKPAQLHQLKDTHTVYMRADADRLRRLFGLADDLSASIEINIAEIKSAVAAIPLERTVLSGGKIVAGTLPTSLTR